MRKLRIVAAIGAVTLFLGSMATQAIAGSFGIGISAQGTHLNANGKETLKTSSATQSASVIKNFTIGSGFIQYEFDTPFVIGLDLIPGSAELAYRSQSRTHLTAADGTTTTITQKAQAEISDHTTLFIETPGWGRAGVFAKAGLIRVDVTTNESLGSGAAYGNTDINGQVFALGVKPDLGNFILKLEASVTDYDDVQLKSTGSDAVTTIDADFDTVAAKLSLGYRF